MIEIKIVGDTSKKVEIENSDKEVKLKIVMPNKVEHELTLYPAMNDGSARFSSYYGNQIIGEIY